MLQILKSKLFHDSNANQRDVWVRSKLQALPTGARILDAGAGEMQYKPFCAHLNYVSQDFAEYTGSTRDDVRFGLHPKDWSSKSVDIISDISKIPEPDGSFDVILCTEVLEHLPEPTLALDEFRRLLRPQGTLILTAPFGSCVHMAPYHFCSGFSQFWYEHHLSKRNFAIVELSANGDWFSLLLQELSRLPGLEKEAKNWIWPIAYLYYLVGFFYFQLRVRKKRADIACFGWHVWATKCADMDAEGVSYRNSSNVRGTS